MSRTTVTVADLGVGNLHSLDKALQRVGAQTQVTANPRDWLAASIFVLPGVGAFGAAMSPLAPVQDEIRQRIQTGTPTLGICIGQQILFESSEESPGYKGLGVLRGTIDRLEPTQDAKIPHMGWNEVSAIDANDMLFSGLQPNDRFYFVHSYCAKPAESVAAAVTEHGGASFPSIVRKGNIVGVQFHPEKSGPAGLQLLGNWLRFAEANA